MKVRWARRLALAVIGPVLLTGSAQTPQIVGGFPTTIDCYPFQVAVRVTIGVQTTTCGGVLLSNVWIVTAAHCLSGANEQAVVVKVGVTTMTDEDWGSDAGWLGVEHVIPHDLIPTTLPNGVVPNDLELLQLKPPGLPASSAATPISIAPATYVPEGNLEVSGWGNTGVSAGPSPILLAASVPYVDNATCNAPASYNGTIGPLMMCAGRAAGGVDSCQGDSGGPLVARTANGFLLVGIVSYGTRCGEPGKYGVYVRLSAFQDWFKSKAGIVPQSTLLQPRCAAPSPLTAATRSATNAL